MRSVDPEFGTGAVKVTPAHDPNDFEIGQRHGLPSVKIFDERATVTRAGGEFAGMDRFEAREAVKHALRKRGHLAHIDEHHHSVGHCYRCGTVVEPFLSLQWFVSVADLTAPAIEAVRDGTTRFVPQRWEKNYFHWMENLRDWCISRQIWWGHRIPAWYCEDCNETIVSREDPDVCSGCGGASLRQDEDVLDTWFSSALWPFSTLGWPDSTADLDRFYPNAVLITGFDIIYFWVARMMQMGLYVMDESPFADIVIHGLVRDASGRKMSKSIGNAIDPLDVIAEHGADPLRLALIQSAAPGHDVPFDLEWVIGARKFGNKIWNAIRFALHHLEPQSVPADGGYPENPGPIDRWILHRLSAVTKRFDELCDLYRFSDAYGLLYNFAWSEVFDWYLEMAKAPLRDPATASATRATLGTVLRDLLKLFHPAIPFVTEELWSSLVGEGLLAGGQWPAPPETGPVVGVESLQEMVTGIRRFKAGHGIAPRASLTVTIVDPEHLAEPWWGEQLEALAAALPRFAESPPAGSGFTRIVAGSLDGYVELEGLIDLEAERARLEKRRESAAADLAQAQRKLSNQSFLEKAPVTLGTVLRDLLKLFHPAIPFVTEELWSSLVGDGLLAGAQWPVPPETGPVAGVESLQEMVTGIRRFKAGHSIAPRASLTVTIVDPEHLAEPWWGEQLEALAAARPRFAGSPPAGSGFTRIVAGSLDGYVELEGLIDLEAERARLEKRRESAASDLAQAQRKLSNQSFLEKAPAEVIDKEKTKAAELGAIVEKLENQLSELGG